MSTVNIKRQHSLDDQECRDVAEDLLGQLVGKYGGKVSKDGQCFNYRHTAGLKATVEPKQGELDINIKFNLMTRSFAPKVEEQLTKVLDEHIGKE